MFATRLVSIHLRLNLVKHQSLSCFCFRVNALLLAVIAQCIFVRHNQGNGVGVLVVVQDTLLNIRRTVCQTVLKTFRTVLLAIGTDQQTFEAAYYPQESRMFLRHISHIAGVQPAVNDRFLCCLGVLPVACHHILAANNNLAAFAVRHNVSLAVAYLHFLVGYYSSAGAEDCSSVGVRADDRRSLAQSVALEHRHSYGAEVSL